MHPLEPIWLQIDASLLRFLGAASKFLANHIKVNHFSCESEISMIPDHKWRKDTPELN